MAMRPFVDNCVLLAIEAAYSVAPTLDASSAIFLMNPQIAPAAEELKRSGAQPHFTGDPHVLVGKHIVLTGECDLIGAVDPGDPAPLGGLYRICGHREELVVDTSSTYSPISRGIASGAIDFFLGGIRFRMLGCRGYMDQSYGVKQFGKATVNITGLLTIPVDGEAPPDIDWSTFQTPPAIQAETWTVTVGGINVCAAELTVQANATVDQVECSEGREIGYVNRKAGGVIRVLKDSPLSTWNPWSIADSHAIVVINNTITGGAPGRNLAQPIRAQLGMPKPANIQNRVGYEIPYTAIATGAGGDEYSLTFT